jgi:acetyltransferase
MLDCAIAFERQPLLLSDRIAIITNAGGPGIMATDACEKAGLQLASLELQTIQALRRALPESASVLNPVDLLGDALAERYARALDAVAEDPGVGGILVILTPQVMTQVVETANVVGELAGVSRKPILACFMGAETVEPGIQVLNRYQVPSYPVPERAVAAMAAMMSHRLWRERPELAVETFAGDRDRVRAALQRARQDGRLAMGDAEAWQILEAYGIPTPRTFLARTADEAVDLAKRIGFPVAIKIASPDILHKTDVGGVTLNVGNPDDVRAAFELTIYRASRYVPEAEIWGCLVQEMVLGGREIIVGMNRDPHFGPVLMFGLGGIYVEALRDVAFRVVPLDRRDAREMISEIRTYHLLRGVRGDQASDLDAVVDALLRLAQLVEDFPEIVEFDVNPLTVFGEGQGLVGIDMRLVLT